jgi:hypothetical protein
MVTSRKQTTITFLQENRVHLDRDLLKNNPSRTKTQEVEDISMVVNLWVQIQKLALAIRTKTTIIP